MCSEAPKANIRYVTQTLISKKIEKGAQSDEQNPMAYVYICMCVCISKPNLGKKNEIPTILVSFKKTSTVTVIQNKKPESALSLIYRSVRQPKDCEYAREPI